jgi:hypothetical protein
MRQLLRRCAQWARRLAHSPAGSARHQSPRARLTIELLESRILLAKNLLLDFAGGTVPMSNNYLLPFQTVYGQTTVFSTTTFAPYVALDGIPDDRTQEILQILAGVREDYASFNLNVYWDDQGVNSPNYHPGDTVVYITNTPDPSLARNDGSFGIASPININATQQVTFGGTVTGGTFKLTFNGQTTAPISYLASSGAVATALGDLTNIGAGNVAVRLVRGTPDGFAITFQNALGGQAQPVLTADGSGLMGTMPTVTASQTFAGGAAVRTSTAFVFEPAAVNASVLVYRQMQELIFTISHEAGHTFGLSHDAGQDSENRQIMTAGDVQNNVAQVARFSSLALNHTAPEMGRVYSEVDRLVQTLGRGSSNNDFQTAQTLPNVAGSLGVSNATLLRFPTSGPITYDSAIDYAGDRDAYQFVAPVSGSYTLTEMATTAALAGQAVETLWSASGFFMQVGTTATSSTMTLNLVGGRTYYLVAGNQYDQQAGIPGFFSTTGNYRITITSNVADTSETRRVVVGQDNQVYEQQISGTGMPMGGYTKVAGGQVENARLVSLLSGQEEVFVEGLDNQVYSDTISPAGSASGNYRLTAPGQVKSFTVLEDDQGRPVVLAVGLDNQVYEMTFDPNGVVQSQYRLVLPGQVRSLIATSIPTGIEIFVLGLDNQVYSALLDSSGKPEGQTYTLTSPGVVLSFDVTLLDSDNPEVFVLGLDHQVYAEIFDGTGALVQPYFLAASGTVKSFQLGRTGDGDPELLVMGLDDQVWGALFTNGMPAGAYFLTAPGQVKSFTTGATDEGDLLLSAIGLDDQVWGQIFQPNGLSAGPYFLAANGQVNALGTGS